MWSKLFLLRKTKKVLAVLLSMFLFATPALAGNVTAKQCAGNLKDLKVKELQVSENDSKFKKLSENDKYKALENHLLTGDFKVGQKRMLEIIDTTDQVPVQILVTTFVKDKKPGLIGVASKNGETYASAILGETSDADGVDILVFTVDPENKVTSQIKRVQKNNNKLLSFFIKPAYAYDSHDFCLDFCNAMCSMGYGFAGCYLLCTGLSAGTGILLCGFLCAGFTWTACNYGCSWWCSDIGL